MVKSTKYYNKNEPHKKVNKNNLMLDSLIKSIKLSFISISNCQFITLDLMSKMKYVL